MKHPIWRRCIVCAATILQASLLGEFFMRNHIPAFNRQQWQGFLQTLWEAAYPTREAAKQATLAEVLVIIEHGLLTILVAVVIISVIIPLLVAIVGLLSGIPVAIYQAIMICIRAYETETAITTNSQTPEEEDPPSVWSY